MKYETMVEAASSRTKRVNKKEIKLLTNTAYLLNTWFPEESMWKDVRKFIEEIHEARNKDLRKSDFIEVTFKLKQHNNQRGERMAEKKKPKKKK